MQQFDCSQHEELNSFLYNNFTHASKIEKTSYDSGCLCIEAYHEFSNVKTNYTFHDVTMLHFSKGDWDGDRHTIFSLTLEDSSAFPCQDNECDQRQESFLYLLLQMLSGDEIHIAFKKLLVDVSHPKKERPIIKMCKSFLKHFLGIVSNIFSFIFGGLFSFFFCALGIVFALSTPSHWSGVIGVVLFLCSPILCITGIVLSIVFRRKGRYRDSYLIQLLPFASVIMGIFWLFLSMLLTNP